MAGVGEDLAAPAPAAELQGLFDAVLTERASLLDAIVERMCEQVPSYRSVPPHDLRTGVMLELGHVIQAARSGREPAGEHELAALAEVGELRALSSVAVGDMLRAWRVGIEVVVARAHELADSHGIGDRSMLRFVEALLAWSDVAMVATAAGHRRTELDLARDDQDRRGAFVRGLLRGELSPAQLEAAAAGYSLDLEREYVALRAHASRHDQGHALQGALGFGLVNAVAGSMGTSLDGDLAGFALVAPATGGQITGAPDGAVGVGPPRPLLALAESFTLATRALLTVRGFGLTGVHDVASLGLLPAVAADAEVGDALCARYIDPLAGEGSGRELVATLRAWFQSGMHVERAAGRLFVHQNTLRYRLGRFEEITGASLRDPVVAFEVWWALQRVVVAPRPPVA